MGRLVATALAVLGLVTASGALGACGGEAAPPPRPPRAVTTVTLARSAPATVVRRTGAVEPFRQEDVAFEVAGRVEEVRGVGDRVHVNVELRDGQVVRTGDVIARLDAKRYELALAGLLARREAAAADLAAREIELERGGDADVAAAEANLEAARQQEQVAQRALESAQAQERIARQTYDSETNLRATGATSQIAVDQAKAALDSAVAAERQAKAALDAAKGTVAAVRATKEKTLASIEQRKAQVVASQAQIAELDQNIARARQDVADCTLRAPFNGRVTAVHVAEGAVVAQGTPIATITLLDPVLVSVALGATENRLLRVGNQALITPPEWPADAPPLLGAVYEQGDVADAATRTFLVKVILRNTRENGSAPKAGPYRTLGLRDVAIVERRRGDDGATRIYVPLSAVSGSDPTTVVRLVGVSAGERREWEDLYSLPTERVTVVLGDDVYANGPWNYREVRETGGLQAQDVVILDPVAADDRGAALTPYDRPLRAGDLVPVELPVGNDAEGFWVPLQCVMVRDGTASVFVVRDDVVREVDVVTHPPRFPGERLRIESDALSADDRVVLTGVQYLADGDRVRTVDGDAR